MERSILEVHSRWRPLTLAVLLGIFTILFGISLSNLSDTKWEFNSYPEFPRAQSLPSLKNLPDNPNIAIEIEGRTDFRIKIINLDSGNVAVWKLPSEIPNTIVERDYLDNWASISWAANTNQLLLNRGGEIDLLNKDRSYTVLHLHMPGKLTPYDGMHDYAISPDGKLVAYSIYTRDDKDRQSDGFGKLYVHLFYQRIDGSKPKELAKNNTNFLPEWSPDRTKIAFRTEADSIVIADLHGQKIVTIAPPFLNRVEMMKLMNYQKILEIKWSPNGTKLAFIFNHKLYLANANRGGSTAVKFDHDIDVESFAWSPKGDKFLFRSSFRAEKRCSFNLFYKFETGKFPTLQSYHLYTSNIDGTQLKRIGNHSEYQIGELFWIR